MKVIHKKVLEITDIQHVPMSSDARILCAQNQGEQLVIWYETDDEADGYRKIVICGTGNPLPEGLKRYIGSAQMGNSLVWHVYEVAKMSPQAERILELIVECDGVEVHASELKKKVWREIIDSNQVNIGVGRGPELAFHRVNL